MRHKRVLTGRNINLAERNGLWAGDKVQLIALHEWVAKRIPKPEVCPRCNQRKAIDLANKGTYDRNLDNWEWLCRRCHMLSDGRLERFISYSSQRKLPEINCGNCGKSFKPRSSKNKFCSISCGLKASNSKRQKTLVCIWCTKTFQGYPIKKTCSVECAREHKTELQRRRRNAA